LKYREQQREKAGRLRSHGGKTAIEIQARNNQIREHSKKTHLTSSGFAQKHAAQYGLKPRRVRDILKMAVGS
jgi:hypothetical protein